MPITRSTVIEGFVVSPSRPGGGGEQVKPTADGQAELADAFEIDQAGDQPEAGAGRSVQDEARVGAPPSHVRTWPSRNLMTASSPDAMS
jgi:hypothetical protein